MNLAGLGPCLDKMDFPVVKSAILVGILGILLFLLNIGTLSQSSIFYSSQLSLFSSTLLFWQMKDLEILYSSLKLGIFLAFNFILQISIASVVNLLWNNSINFKYDVLLFSLFLKYHKIIAPVWNFNLLLLSPLVLLSSFSNIFLSLLSEKISDLIVPRVSDLLYNYSKSRRNIDKNKVNVLMEMGFERKRAEEALELHGGNLESAATWLLSS